MEICEEAEKDVQYCKMDSWFCHIYKRENASFCATNLAQYRLENTSAFREIFIVHKERVIGEEEEAFLTKSMVCPRQFPLPMHPMALLLSF